MSHQTIMSHQYSEIRLKVKKMDREMAYKVQILHFWNKIGQLYPGNVKLEVQLRFIDRPTD